MTNPLIALRLALPGEPSLRDLARRVGISHEMLRRFEEGRNTLSEDNLVSYARTVRADRSDVMRKFEKVRIALLKAQLREAEARLRGAILEPRRRGRPRRHQTPGAKK